MKNVTYYKVEYCTGESDWILATIHSGTNSYIIQSLNLKTQHQVRVTAVIVDGTNSITTIGLPSATATVMTASAASVHVLPSIRVSAAASAAGTTIVTLNFRPPNNAAAANIVG